MTLEEHLAAGYNFYVRGRHKPWTPEFFVEQLKADAELLAAARTKQRDVKKVLDAGRLCDISKTQNLILTNALQNVGA